MCPEQVGPPSWRGSWRAVRGRPDSWGGRASACGPAGQVGVAASKALCVLRRAGGHVPGTAQTWVPP